MCVTRRARAHVSFVSSEGDDAIEKYRIYGALNLAHNMVTWNKVSCSLPLMGIENLRVRGAGDQADGHLITPYGDRKLAAVGARHGPGGLITPHGDRKPAARCPCGARQHDLITPHGDRKPHYPSWGSKTRRRRAENRGRDITPHGDRKPAAPADELEANSLPLLPHLITPHGDRKRPGRSPCRLRRTRVSLPLMGIENPLALGCGPVEPASRGSLPLMGIENMMIERPPQGRRSESHYPSWGSKTRCTAWQTGSGASHYPSWGSKTLSESRAKESILHSLPLMGIENTVPRSSTCSAIYHSLPLMGIENLSMARRAAFSASFSLPLIGIENRTPKAGCPCASGASLPLMGIENSCRRHRRRAIG